jgi:DnaK suppressor protein
MSNPATWEAQRVGLLRRQVRVQEKLIRLRQAMQVEVDGEPDEGDAEVLEQAKNTALIGVLERRLQEINAALRALDKGMYGTCQRCAEPIDKERLQAKPDATLCLACQRAVEASRRPRRVPLRSGR